MMGWNLTAPSEPQKAVPENLWYSSAGVAEVGRSLPVANAGAAGMLGLGSPAGLRREQCSEHPGKEERTRPHEAKKDTTPKAELAWRKTNGGLKRVKKTTAPRKSLFSMNPMHTYRTPKKAKRRSEGMRRAMRVERRPAQAKRQDAPH
jgi:hypothetical protein